MFSFLRKRREQAAARTAEKLATELLTACDVELERTVKADWRFVAMPRDMSERGQLLTQAAAAGLSDRPVVQKLSFYQRLLTALNGRPELEAMDRLLTEARSLGFRDGDAIRKLVAVAEAELFNQHGLRAIEADGAGRAVYLRCVAEFKNQPGQLEVRDDGLCFRGEVLVEIPGTNVQHVAATGHTYRDLDYPAVAIQEGKRRTPTKFAFPPYHHGAEHACRIVLAVWEQRSAQPTSPVSVAPSRNESETATEPDWSGHGYLGSAGESQYQAALAQVARGGRFHSATLVPEPENPFDRNAVCVQIDGMTVGYLSRPDARRYQKRLLAMTEPIQIPAKLLGGTDDKPFFGVLLDCRAVERLPTPKRTRKKAEAFDATDEPF